MLESLVNVYYPGLYGGKAPMAKCVPGPRDWVREQVDLYESSGGTEHAIAQPSHE
jgi:hypothetical protein